MERDQSTTIRMLVIALLVALVAIVALSLALCSRATDQNQNSVQGAPAVQTSVQQDETNGDRAADAQGAAAPDKQDDWDDAVADEGDGSASDTAASGEGGSSEQSGEASTSASEPDNTGNSSSEAESSAQQASIDENGTYTSKDDVALYIHTYGHLPSNFVSKSKAKKAGWVSKEGNLGEVLPGMSIGGSEFYNNEGVLPDAAGRTWTECDINYQGGYRGAERIVFSNDGLIFYTSDHYKTFEQLY